MEHTLALIGRAHQEDKEARDTLFEENEIVLGKHEIRTIGWRG